MAGRCACLCSAARISESMVRVVCVRLSLSRMFIT